MKRFFIVLCTLYTFINVQAAADESKKLDELKKIGPDLWVSQSGQWSVGNNYGNYDGVHRELNSGGHKFIFLCGLCRFDSERLKEASMFVDLGGSVKDSIWDDLSHNPDIFHCLEALRSFQQKEATKEKIKELNNVLAAWAFFLRVKALHGEEQRVHISCKKDEKEHSEINFELIDATLNEFTLRLPDEAGDDTKPFMLWKKPVDGAISISPCVQQ